MQQTAIIVLAAGEGKRMSNDGIPKPLQQLNGKPFINYLLESIGDSGVCDTPTIVVGHNAETVKAALGDSYQYVFQAERLGTGHAVKVCRDSLYGKSENIIVLYADHPFVTPETIRSLEDLHINSGATMTMMTTTVPDFDDWRQTFAAYGRVRRSETGELLGIVEAKDATEDEKKITEVSPSFFAFKSDWLFKNLESLKKENVQGEYYLTDLLEIAFTQNEPITSMSVEPEIAVGINTPAELQVAEAVLHFDKSNVA